MMKYILLIVLLLSGVHLSAQQNDGTLLGTGTVTPAFSFEAEKGKTVSIADYKGKIVLINFLLPGVVPAEWNSLYCKKRYGKSIRTMSILHY